jgi:hypothetical protein
MVADVLNACMDDALTTSYSVDDLARRVDVSDTNRLGVRAGDDLVTDANVAESIVTLLPKQDINASNSTFLNMKGWSTGN